MKSYDVQPDLTSIGLEGLSYGIRSIMEEKMNRVDLDHGTIIYKVPSKNPKKFTIKIDMKIEEE